MFPFLKFDTPERRAHALSLGPVKFIALYGVLAWGCLTALIFSVFAPLLGFVPDPREGLSYMEKVMSAAPLSFAVFPACGVLWGAAMWFVMRKVETRAR
jgi:hypothetical protein